MECPTAAFPEFLSGGEGGDGAGARKASARLGGGHCGSGSSVCISECCCSCFSHLVSLSLSPSLSLSSPLEVNSARAIMRHHRSAQIPSDVSGRGANTAQQNCGQSFRFQCLALGLALQCNVILLRVGAAMAYSKMFQASGSDPR